MKSLLAISLDVSCTPTRASLDHAGMRGSPPRRDNWIAGPPANSMSHRSHTLSGPGRDDGAVAAGTESGPHLRGEAFFLQNSLYARREIKHDHRITRVDLRDVPTSTCPSGQRLGSISSPYRL